MSAQFAKRGWIGQDREPTCHRPAAYSVHSVIAVMEPFHDRHIGTMAKSDLSPERALAELRKIQRHRVRINKAAPISGISAINDSQAEVLETLKIRKPTQDAQLTLL